MMRKMMVLVLLVLLTGGAAEAQKYVTALGVRLGRQDAGLSLQQKILPKTTIEGMATFRSREVTATVLAEQHFPILGRRLNYYLGAGAHVGALKDFGATYGIDGILGLEFSLYPLNISYDIKPAVHLRHEDWANLHTGFTVRYILVKEKKKKRKFWIFGKEVEEKKDTKKKFRLFNKEEEEEDDRKWYDRFRNSEDKDDKSKKQEPERKRSFFEQEPQGVKPEPKEEPKPKPNFFEQFKKPEQKEEKKLTEEEKKREEEKSKWFEF